MKLFWMIVAGACILLAAVFLLRRDLNAAFVSAAVGLVAWFLNYRAQMRAIVAAADREDDRKRNVEGDEDSDD